MRIIGNNPSVPRQEHAVASGTLTNGKPVVVNADGTVSVVGIGAAAQLQLTRSDSVVVAVSGSILGATGVTGASFKSQLNNPIQLGKNLSNEKFVGNIRTKKRYR